MCKANRIICVYLIAWMRFPSFRARLHIVIGGYNGIRLWLQCELLIRTSPHIKHIKRYEFPPPILKDKMKSNRNRRGARDLFINLKWDRLMSTVTAVYRMRVKRAWQWQSAFQSPFKLHAYTKMMSFLRVQTLWISISFNESCFIIIRTAVTNWVRIKNHAAPKKWNGMCIPIFISESTIIILQQQQQWNECPNILTTALLFYKLDFKRKKWWFWQKFRALFTRKNWWAMQNKEKIK